MPTYSIASGSYDGRVRVYDIRMGKTTVDVLGAPVTSVRCSGDGNAILVSTLDGRIRMLDRGDGKLLQAFPGNKEKEKEGTGKGPVYRNEELRIRSVFAAGDGVVLSGSEAERSESERGERKGVGVGVLGGLFLLKHRPRPKPGHKDRRMSLLGMC